MKPIGALSALLLATIATVCNGCHIHSYCYNLDREYVGLADCEIKLFMQSVDYDRERSTKNGDKSFTFIVWYQCLAAVPEQQLEFKNVAVSPSDGVERTVLELTDSTTYPNGFHILQFGFFYKPKRLDSILLSFDLTVPDGMAAGAPRSGHYDIRGALHDEKYGLYEWMIMHD